MDYKNIVIRKAERWGQYYVRGIKKDHRECILHVDQLWRILGNDWPRE